MCVKFSPSCARATVEPYPRSHRLRSSLSPRIAAERKNHLAITRACNEANTVEIDESETFKKRAVMKNCALQRSAGRAATIFIK